MGAAEGRGTNQKDTLLLASHLIIHLPPRVGAYVLASHPDLARITPDITGGEANSRSQFQVRQNAQFRSPQHLAQPQAAIEAAREQAILGHVPPYLIPALATPNTDILNRKITWTLRFPLPASAEGDPQTHRFADLALHASGHRSAAALRTPFNLPPPQLHQSMSHPTLASSASPTQPTVTRTPYKTQLLRPPRLSFDGYERVLLVYHHASSRTPPLALIARKLCFCSLVANSAFRNAPSSSPNTKRTNRRRSPKPKRPSTDPRRPIASPITVSTSTCHRRFSDIVVAP